VRAQGKRKFFTAAEAAATLGMTTAEIMTLVDTGGISCLWHADETVEFEQGDFDKYLERKAEQALLAEILARGPSGAKEWALLKRYPEARIKVSGQRRANDWPTIEANKR
jgi:hypothetical protein